MAEGKQKKTLEDRDEDDLFSLYCDLYQTAREWMASGTALDLDEVVDAVCFLTHFEDLVDLEALQRAVPLVPPKRGAAAILTRMRDSLRRRCTPRHLDSSALRDLKDDLREQEAELQRFLGKLQGAVEDVSGIKERLAMRNKVQSLVQMAKRVKDFASTLSDVGELEWESNYSTLRLCITPKKGRAYRPFGSKFFECRMERETAIEVSVQPDHLRLIIDGDFQFTFLGVRTVPTLQARAITIHRMEGVRMEGAEATLTVWQERGVSQVSVQ
ncbi:MAG TPA: hypothetical protein ENN54_05050 [Thermoplasmatales archaeon]|nr:hypothetical protein [Thermoplasmatales archaeon]